MERSIIFNNYKSLGVDDKNDKLIINTSLNKENLGELIILVGPNNSGKSNILKGLSSLSTGLSSNDRTNFLYKDEVKPELSLIIKENGNKYKYKKTPEISQVIYFNGEKEIKTRLLSQEVKEKILKILKLINRYNNSNFNSLKAALNKLLNGQPISSTDYEIITNRLVNAPINQLYSSTGLNREEMANICNEINNFIEDKSNNEEIQKEFLKKYGFKLVPTITYYNSNDVYNQSDLCSDVNSISEKPFFKGLLSLLGIDVIELSSCYEQFNRSNNTGFLNKYSERLNEKLIPITEEFNKVYSANSEKYNFQFALFPNQIYFNVYQSDIPLTIEEQSEGFKWFFNFFFKFSPLNKLSIGDIVLMDEPATNLHAYGQVELRKFLKFFAKKTGITFILSTHSPFLIDCDNLDEIRVITKRDGKTCIDNRFTIDIDEEQVDTLGPIVDALTVRRSVILNPENTVVFVEGITDYNYLTAFKNYFNIDDITFLPINGLKQEEILEKLSKIIRKPLLLVDSDNIAKDIQKEAQNSKSPVEVISLGDVDSKFIFVESLFSDTDRKKYAVQKGYSLSRDFKNNINTLEITKMTKDNFYKVINYIRA